MQSAAQLPVASHLDVDALVQAELDQIEWFFHRLSGRGLESTRGQGLAKTRVDQGPAYLFLFCHVASQLVGALNSAETVIVQMATRCSVLNEPTQGVSTPMLPESLQTANCC